MSTGSLAERSDLVPGAPLSTIDRGVLPTTEVVARVLRIQEVMKALMKDGVHYGTIPGTPKPTLYKPGAELLLMTFRIAASPALIDDLSNHDEVRYRVTMRGTNQQSGEVIGEMVGECSSSEEKYRWRKPVCKEEFDETDPTRRRSKWQRKGSDAEKVDQVRTSPADVANTVLKMAVKRAFVALALSALGASDIFAQDLEDLTEEMRESVASGDAPKQSKEPQRKSAGGSTAAAKSKAPTVPADAQVLIGLVDKVERPKNQKFSAIRMKGDQRSFTAWNDSGEQLLKDADQFAGIDHKVKLLYVERTKDNKTHCNAVGISIADAEPVATPAAGSPALPLDAATVSPFSKDRQPGEDG